MGRDPDQGLGKFAPRMSEPIRCHAKLIPGTYLPWASAANRAPPFQEWERPDPAMPVIETLDLTKRYGRRAAKSILAVDQVSFSVEEGQVFAFLGPNGCGKTTTIGMLVGIINPSGGSFRLFGASDPKGLLAARSRVGATLETPNFYPYMSGRDNLRITATLKGVDRPRIEECLEIVGLADRAKHRFRTYSLGMKQRLALAATMPNDPI